SLLFKATPDQVRFLLIDPKRVELSMYDGVPHLLAPVVTDPKKASGYLRWVVEEMENRYRLFQLAGARNIGQYNEMVRLGIVDEYVNAEEAEHGGGSLDNDGSSAEAGDGADASPKMKPLSYIVVIIDELADLMLVAQREVEDAIARLAFMARAAGIHLIIATQRPSVDIVTGIIKSNIPSRIAFAVSSQVDSRIILDTSGAEHLLGKGDMLFHPVGLPKPIRVQGAYISDEEVSSLVGYLKRQGKPTYEAEAVDASDNTEEEGIAEDDDLFPDAARLAVGSGEASISKIQRRFRVGYARAARLIDTMEVLGIIGPYEGSKPRKVLITEEELEDMLGDRGLI
ncbi:MAG: FtsK/SpoIIIE domain-containing protein, partial [Firmicutes bacterium]|nr:FtsK/SpoIIIE domain-containing protein [Bacillota bacterium]